MVGKTVVDFHGLMKRIYRTILSIQYSRWAHLLEAWGQFSLYYFYALGLAQESKLYRIWFLS